VWRNASSTVGTVFASAEAVSLVSFASNRRATAGGRLRVWPEAIDRVNVLCERTRVSSLTVTSVVAVGCDLSRQLVSCCPLQTGVPWYEISIHPCRIVTACSVRIYPDGARQSDCRRAR